MLRLPLEGSSRSMQSLHSSAAEMFWSVLKTRFSLQRAHETQGRDAGSILQHTDEIMPMPMHARLSPCTPSSTTHCLYRSHMSVGYTRLSSCKLS